MLFYELVENTQPKSEMLRKLSSTCDDKKSKMIGFLRDTKYYQTYMTITNKI